MRNSILFPIISFAIIAVVYLGYLRLGNEFVEIDFDETEKQAKNESLNSSNNSSPSNGQTIEKSVNIEFENRSQKPSEKTLHKHSENKLTHAEIIDRLDDDVREEAAQLSEKNQDNTSIEALPGGGEILRINSGWGHTPVAVINEDGDVEITEY